MIVGGCKYEVRDAASRSWAAGSGVILASGTSEHTSLSFEANL